MSCVSALIFPSFVIFVYLTFQFYSYYTAVSGTSLFESWVYTGFNFILGLPIIFFGFLDRDLSEEFMLKYPQVTNTQTICRFFALFKSLSSMM